LIESSGGVFEVEYHDRLIFSKKALGRFPADGEVQAIIKGLDCGLDLDAAQAEAAAGVADPISFFDWLKGYLSRKKPRA